MQGACARTHSYLAEHSMCNLPKCAKNKIARDFFYVGEGNAEQLRWRRNLCELTLCPCRRGPASEGRVRLSWWRRGSCGSPPWRRATTGATLPSQTRYAQHAQSRCPDTRPIPNPCDFSSAEGLKKKVVPEVWRFFLRRLSVLRFFGCSSVLRR